jgi:queuine tRNA-ribosyltransferase
MSFTVHNTYGKARRGTLQTAHGVVETPVFMPIATVGSVKSLLAPQVKELGASIILGNTYHLLLRPGAEVLRAGGGLPNMMGWPGPMLTDSGGYQVFSLSHLLKTQEEGVVFRSHIDGRLVELTPESSLEMQAAIGSDIRMQFDDVAAGNSPRERYEEAMERSLRWAERSAEAFARTQDEAAWTAKHFGIVQGGTHEDLRERSAAGLMKIGFDGYAIGGLSVGEERAAAYRIVRTLADQLPQDRPRYFMGGGMPEEIVYYVVQGVDMFDCVLPTRNARHGVLFVWAGEPRVVVRQALQAAQAGAADTEVAALLYRKVHISNEQFTADFSPIDAWATAETSRALSKAYLRHLLRAEELTGLTIATMQNLSFYLGMMAELRAILAEYGDRSTTAGVAA